MTSATPLRRWAFVALVATVLGGSPYLWRALPVDDPDTDAASLLMLAQGSADVGFSGYVESQGDLQLPVTDQFTDLADLLVDRTRMRVWWRSSVDWRVNALEATGETDLVHDGARTLVWEYERSQASVSAEPRVRLPRASDLLPNELGRQLLTGATTAEVSRLPARRVAGVEAPGLRVVPSLPQSSIDHADIWVDPASGLPVQVALYGDGDGADPSLSTRFLDLDVTMPPPERTGFTLPPGADLTYDDVIDVADGADRYAPTRTPRRLAGLDRREGSGRAVGSYGVGATVLFALPLEARVSEPLREQLATTADVRVDAAGSALTVGPLNLLLTPEHADRPSWLLAGTVVPPALRRAAHRVDAPVVFVARSGPLQ